jgi:hypothetical protein
MTDGAAPLRHARQPRCVRLEWVTQRDAEQRLSLALTLLARFPTGQAAAPPVPSPLPVDRKECSA